MQCQVVEYRSLTMQQLVEPSTVSVELAYSAQQQVGGWRGVESYNESDAMHMNRFQIEGEQKQLLTQWETQVGNKSLYIFVQ